MIESGVFTVSVLPVTASMGLIGQFGFKSGREIDKFAGVSFRLGTTGVPILLEHSIGYLEAEVSKRLDVETHTVFIGKLGREFRGNDTERQCLLGRKDQ
ncbi:hypothetical protein JCM15765_21150 [Paradesulfitobacterium aromaticivorans]